jgi:hypothetical protein
VLGTHALADRHVFEKTKGAAEDTVSLAVAEMHLRRCEDCLSQAVRRASSYTGLVACTEEGSVFPAIACAIGGDDLVT